MRTPHSALARLGLVVGASLSLALGGCSGQPVGVPVSADNRGQAQLSDVAELYRMYTFEKKKAPTKTSDLTFSETMSPLGVHAIQDGSVVVRLGAKMTDLAEGPESKDSPDEVLGYEKDVPTQGGWVVMLNRKVKKMTAEEFKAAKLAGTEDSKPSAKK